ncbi:MAG TPA: transcription-repair coupling factor [Pseudomonadales bacterium]|nr:transcription-repair coupling factor [Pseudomonadales bacterium]
MANPEAPPLPERSGDRIGWSGLVDGAASLAIARAAQHHDGLLLAIAANPAAAYRLCRELEFFSSGTLDVVTLPDWETLAYDAFSPHQDIVSDRLRTLHRLPTLRRGVLVVPIRTLLQRLPPPSFLAAHSLVLSVGARFDAHGYRRHLEQAGYRYVETVSERGEFAVRGSLVDVYPMGSPSPYRIDLFDDEVASLRTFDPDSQRTIEQIDSVEILPAKEFPLTPDAIACFRNRWHELFDVDVRRCPIYQDVSQGMAPSGIEYYLPMFHDALATVFDYLPANCVAVMPNTLDGAVTSFQLDVRTRYESLRHDIERPILPPDAIYLRTDELFHSLGTLRQVVLDGRHHSVAFTTRELPDVSVNHRAHHPGDRLAAFVKASPVPVLFCAESAGRREVFGEFLGRSGVHPTDVADFASFRSGAVPLALTIAPIETAAFTDEFALITETQVFGARAEVEVRRDARSVDPDQIIRNLTELHMGAAVVHIEHGVGRYLGLRTLEIDGAVSEFLTIEYADEAKLYVPVTALHLISRYGGADEAHAPLHRLGSDQWDKAKRRAAEKIHDVAAELLNIYAHREARVGTALAKPDEEYQRFADQFPFDVTPDQRRAIEEVISDLTSPKSMDRLICGDVGFGKTEVAMRAAFIAVQNRKQVAILVPTTLLAQQHHESFRDRFADWPIAIEAISRLRTESEIDAVRQRLRAGAIDIVIGTHKLLNTAFSFKELGLVIIDEEHRFGVRQKERLRTLRAEVDVLTLTATPIPRTLNLAMGGIRDLSIIATPPARRLSVKTFVVQRRKHLIREAITRELARGGQVFYLHNEVRTIEQTALEIGELVPEARIVVGHGQMPKRRLEVVMGDFYHRRSNVLVCTTIIETGIDIPNANTMIMERADKFGLAQLHQLRGRVGRSHRQAYAYLLIPHPKALTEDARKRLEAIEAAGELGVGFTLATHDLEIRGAGELLGEEQSGQIESIGFSLYMDMLDRAVRAIRAGKTPDLDADLTPHQEVNLRVPALIPEDYLPDVHSRLILYKRISSAENRDALDELRAEIIDRFGALPVATKTLFRITELRLTAAALGIARIDFGPTGGRIEFAADTRVDPFALVRLVQREPNSYRLEDGTRLRVTAKLDDIDARFERVTNLLERLEPTEKTRMAASA